MHPVAQSPPMPDTTSDDAEAGRPLVPASQPNTKKKYSTTMLDHFYLVLLMLSGARLISAVVVAGLCAGIVSRVPTGPLMGIAVYGIFHSVLHFHLFQPKMRSATVPTPTRWFLGRLTVYTIGWIVVSVGMLALVGRGTETGVFASQFQKRLRKGGGGSLGSQPLQGARLLRVLSAISGGFALLAFAICVAQWWIVWELQTRYWSAREVEEEHRNQQTRMKK
ncbi:hypothetical protein F5X68DRAFT_244164 [Plectosphaerella plurivora]|uniref:Uncharacterized protein n=1 Tax=Plectosphaerella plurivora TaxID=936078 RepID=A0A9P8VLT3_9PEZI|nr:hypothetical protein F5X68DRAFT_244164 [Plectosphaerella plurivora]